MSIGITPPVVRIVLTAISFVVYVAAVLTLHQDKVVPFDVEEIGPIPAALSHRLYGTPPGLIDSALAKFFFEAEQAGTPAKEVVDRVMQGAVTPSGQTNLAMDGIGIGGIAGEELAFTLFGTHARSQQLLYLLLIGVSTGLFVVRYGDERMSAAPILLAALTLLLLTPLSAAADAREVPIGGVRYYAIVGTLPALHWCFEFFDLGVKPRIASALRWALLGGQLPILALGLLVRGSPVYLLLPLIGSIGIALWRYGRSRWRMVAVLLVAPTVLVLVGIDALAEFRYPPYAESGLAFVNIWHRAFIGLGIHPDWPFPGVREAYQCPEIPEGIVASTVDRNGHCVWWDYARKHQLSASFVIEQIYGPDYERAMREAYFDVIRKYPRRVLETFLYYKPLLAWDTMRGELPNLSLSEARTILPMAIMQIVLVIAFIVTRPPAAPLRDVALRIGVLLPFLIGVIVPLLIAWAAPQTVVDLLAYILCACILALWLVVSLALYVGMGTARLLLAR
jgi:hypothetical protein